MTMDTLSPLSFYGICFAEQVDHTSFLTSGFLKYRTQVSKQPTYFISSHFSQKSVNASYGKPLRLPHLLFLILIAIYASFRDDPRPKKVSCFLPCFYCRRRQRSISYFATRKKNNFLVHYISCYGATFIVQQNCSYLTNFDFLE